MRQGENYAIRTCDLVPDHSRIDKTLMPKQSYISVVPTWVSRLSPLVDILAPVAGNYTVADSFGRTIASGRYVPDDHAAFSVMLPAIAGVYVLKITDDEGHKRSVKVIVQ